MAERSDASVDNAVTIKRVYLAPAPEDGRRVLVDGLWPRGLTREAAAVEEWMRDVAPSAALRRWFGHDPARWDDFRARYREELAAPVRAALIDRLAEMARMGRLTIVYGARDEARNQAVVIAEAVRARLVRPLAERQPLYVYRNRESRGVVISAAPADAVIDVFGGGGSHGEGGLADEFGGAIFYRDDETGARYLGVWGSRKASRFRRLLRESGRRFEIVRGAPPARVIFWLA